MKNYYISAALFFSICTISLGQQLAHSSFIESAKHYWNPAVSGMDDQMRTSVFLRQQWIGFGGSAPRTGFLSFQYPFDDLNMEAGAIIDFDQTGPVSKKGLQITYAYKIKGILGSASQLSLGINAGFQQYVFDPSNQSFNDVDDQLIQGTSASSLYPVLGGGLYYLSSTEEYKENILFVGLAMRNAFTTEVLINKSNQARERHLHFNIGTRIYYQTSFVEPSLTLNYSNPEILDLRLGARYEMQDAFWLGVGYSTINEVSLQGGIILPEFWDRYGSLRIGMSGNLGLSSELADFGPGVEVFIGYGYDL